MSQKSFNITTGDANTGVTMRAEINASLQALASVSSGPTAPTTTYACQLWGDTANNLLKMRTVANDGWVIIGDLDIAYLKLAHLAVANEFSASQQLEGDALLWRFKDTGGGGVEWGIRSDGGNLEIVENTGTEGSPTWTVRGAFTSNGPTSSPDEGNVSNGSLVTVVASDTTLLTLDLGTVTNGDKIILNLLLAGTKGLAAGLLSIYIAKDSGAATIEFLSGVGASVWLEDLEVSGLLRFTESVVLKITGSGTCVLKIHGQSLNSDFTINAGDLRCGYLFLNKQ